MKVRRIRWRKNDGEKTDAEKSSFCNSLDS